MKFLKIAVIVILIIIVLGAIAFFSAYTIERKQLEQLEFQTVDMTKVEDGVYKGNAATSLIKVEVEVTVENHKIENIKILKHENGMGAAAESITENMVQSNTYEVDAVSRATSSSQVIKSAVCNALLKGIATT